MFYSVLLALCLMVIGLRGDSTTDTSVDGFDTTMSIIDNFTGVYMISRDMGEAITLPVATTTENVTIPRNIVEPAENNTRFVCGKHNPCHWLVYTEQRKVEMAYPSVCDCPNNTACRYYRDNISIRAYEFRCMNLTTDEPETSSATEMASSTDLI